MRVRSDPAKLIAEARQILDPFIARLARQPQVEGVVLLSSMAVTGQRVTFDEMSDIDLTVWLRCGMRADQWRPAPRATRRLVVDRAPQWLGNFSFDLPMRWGMVEVNVHQRLIEYDLDTRTIWDDAMREAHAYTAEILHDPNSNVARLLNMRTSMSEAERLDRLIRLANRLEWDIRRAPERMFHRGDVAAAHGILGAAVDEMIELLYALAGRFMPHRKWRLAGLTWYGLASAAELALLKAAMRVAGLTTRELRRRMDALEQLWLEVHRRLPSGFPTEPYRYYSANVSANRQLRPRTFADEVAERYSRRLGPAVYDLTNFLLAGRSEDLANLDESTVLDLPVAWRELALSLRELVRGDLADGRHLTASAAKAGPTAVAEARTS